MAQIWKAETAFWFAKTLTKQAKMRKTGPSEVISSGERGQVSLPAESRARAGRKKEKQMWNVERWWNVGIPNWTSISDLGLPHTRF